MANRRASQFAIRLAGDLSRMAARTARVAIREHSKTLSRATLVEPVDATVPEFYSAGVRIPFYWARYLHDGRSGFAADRTSFLIFFLDPRRDPRNRRGVAPASERDVRSLKKKEMQAISARNRLDRARGRRPSVIITREVGPAPATRFFENAEGMSPFVVAYGSVASQKTQEFFKVFLRGQVKFGSVEKFPGIRIQTRL